MCYLCCVIKETKGLVLCILKFKRFDLGLALSVNIDLTFRHIYSQGCTKVLLAVNQLFSYLNWLRDCMCISFCKIAKNALLLFQQVSFNCF